MPKFAKLLETIDEDKKDNKLTWALCFLDDCIEHGNDQIFQVV